MGNTRRWQRAVYVVSTCLRVVLYTHPIPAAAMQNSKHHRKDGAQMHFFSSAQTSSQAQTTPHVNSRPGGQLRFHGEQPEPVQQVSRAARSASTTMKPAGAADAAAAEASLQETINPLVTVPSSKLIVFGGQVNGYADIIFTLVFDIGWDGFRGGSEYQRVPTDGTEAPLTHSNEASYWYALQEAGAAYRLEKSIWIMQDWDGEEQALKVCVRDVLSSISILLLLMTIRRSWEGIITSLTCRAAQVISESHAHVGRGNRIRIASIAVCSAYTSPSWRHCHPSLPILSRRQYYSVRLFSEMLSSSLVYPKKGDTNLENAPLYRINATAVGTAAHAAMH